MKLSLAKEPEIRKFTYIDDAKKRGAHLRVLEGAERKTFDSDAPKQFYHLLIVDTSRGHPGLPSKDLLTKEAWQTYMDAIVEDGVVCVHTSSRDFDLAKVVASTSDHLGLAHLHVHDGRGDRELGHYTSEWVVVARKAEHLNYLREAGIARNRMNPGRAPHEKLVIEKLLIDPKLIFTDAGSNSLSAVLR